MSHAGVTCAAQVCGIPANIDVIATVLSLPPYPTVALQLAAKKMLQWMHLLEARSKSAECLFAICADQEHPAAKSML